MPAAQLEPTAPLLEQKDRPRTDILHADGRRCIEYHDNPGKFFAPNGLPIPPDEARALGADVDGAAKRAKILRLKRKQEQELERFKAELEQATEEEIEAASEAAQAVDEASMDDLEPEYNKDGHLRGTRDLKMRHHAQGRWFVHRKGSDGQPDGESLHDDPLPAAEAVKFMLDWHADQAGIDS